MPGNGKPLDCPSRRQCLTLPVLGALWAIAPPAAFAQGRREDDRSAAPTPATPLPIRTEPGRTYLVDRDGRPFFLHGDTAWSLIADLKREDAEHYLEDRRARGFNALLVNLLENKFARHAPRNAYGAFPFDREGDFATPNEAYFAHADWVVDQASARGLIVLLAPAYVGYSGGEQGWYRHMRASGAAKLRAYGRFLGQRYRHMRNIVWVHGGDYNPPDRQLVRVIAEGIREFDTTSLHTAHCAPETIASDYWGSEAWLDFNTLYTYQPVHLQARRALDSRAQRPIILLESAYEHEHGAGEHRIRMQAYQALLSRTAGHVYGNNPIWHFDGPGLHPAPGNWRSQLGSRGAQSMAHLLSLFKTIPWWRLTPDFGGRMLVSGAGPAESRAVAAFADDGSLALVYTPEARTLDIKTAVLKGSQIEARWYDPSSGSFDPVGVKFPGDDSVRQLTPPRRGTSGAEDWVLLLRPVA